MGGVRHRAFGCARCDDNRLGDSSRIRTITPFGLISRAHPSTSELALLREPARPSNCKALNGWRSWSRCLAEMNVRVLGMFGKHDEVPVEAAPLGNIRLRIVSYTRTMHGMRMKSMTIFAAAALLCACSTPRSGTTGRPAPVAIPKPGHCAFASPPAAGACIGGCSAQAGDMSDPQYHSKYHSCIHECQVQQATWSPPPECR